MEAGVSLEVSEWANMKGESEKNLIVIPLSFSLRGSTLNMDLPFDVSQSWEV